MSHELRTPLNGILGIAEALQDDYYGAVSPQQRSALRDVDASGRHLLSLINDILDLSKIEAGKLALNPAPTSVAETCQASLHMVKEIAQKKRLRVELSIDPRGDAIVADQRRLKQILVNLLSNAVKFTPEGGAVGLETAADGERGTLAFTVWDSGIGIARRTSAGCSSRSPSSTASCRGPTPAPDWAWRWCAAWPRCTAAACPSRANPARAAVSP